jgi:hypothetical protein
MRIPIRSSWYPHCSGDHRSPRGIPKRLDQNRHDWGGEDVSVHKPERRRLGLRHHGEGLRQAVNDKTGLEP